MAQGKHWLPYRNPRKRRRGVRPVLKSGDPAWFDMQRILSSVHNFSFERKPSKRYTPQEKAAISRQWNKYAREAEAVNEKQNTFVKASKYMRKQYRHEGWTTTNKGIIMPTPGKKAKIVGRGKTRHIAIDRIHEPTQLFAERTSYFEFPEHVFQHPDKIRQYVADVWAQFAANSVALAVNGFRGKFPMENIEMWWNYNIFGDDFREHDVAEYAEQLAERSADGRHPFTGFYLSYYTDPQTGARIKPGTI